MADTLERGTELIHGINPEGGMGFAGWKEILLGADVELE